MLLKSRMVAVMEWIKKYGYHLLFTLALLSLSSLIAWWSILIYDYINLQYENTHQNLSLASQNFAVMLGYSSEEKPHPGIIEEDDRLEIVECSLTSGDIAYPIVPLWENLCVQPRESIIQQLEDKFDSRIIMIIGESALLIIVIIISIGMLYRLIRVERKTILEFKDFSNRLTHEIKTPITGLRVLLETLLVQPFSKNELIPLLELGLKEIDRQEQLANNILMGQQLDKREMKLDLQSLDIFQFIKKYIESYEYKLNPVSLVLEDIPNENLYVVADKVGLKHIFNNLVDNAIKYSDSNDPFEFNIRYTKKKCSVIFKDKGIGFPPNQSKKLFEAYRRLDNTNARHTAGTGMGLYLSRRLARKMGGDLKAYSQGESKGAEFILTLKRTGRVIMPIL